ncbi:MAG TPA: methyltransferase domain-containing protein [Acidimicrobiales bacterium]|nr:methyltransferase domain-containing protein [Acidimicrobiales bacterium]
MTTIEVRSSFDQMQALAMRLITGAECLAALIARLELDAAGEAGDPAITAQLDRVVELMGAADLRIDLGERERATVIGHATTMLRQAIDLIDDPLRSGGWYYTDPQILQGQGASSVVIAQLIAGAGFGGEGVRILDIGTGVGALAVAFCRTFKNSRVVGLDTWELSLELARQNVAAAGLGSRITLQAAAIDGFDDEDGFDLVWMPVIFLSRAILEDAVAHATSAMRPGAQIVLGRYVGPEDPIAGALGDLRTIRSGGTLLDGSETRALLEGAGLVDVREVDRTWPAPVALTAGRRPEI